MSTAVKKRRGLYSIGEEIFSSVSHGIGALIGIAALVLMVVFAARAHNVYGVVSGSIYGATMILLFTMSTLYHAIQAPRAKKVFRVIDHCSIYLLIAGTYTPVMLCTLRQHGGWAMFGVVWGVSILGIVLNSINLEKFKLISLISYIVLGWAVVTMWSPMRAGLPMAGIWLLISGGLVYMVGVIFYCLKKIPYMHSIWHLFVLGGSVLHFLCILLYVMPVKI
ncbi:MAG: hemolysin III family protein [Oscillospiraceae bacterium]|nr:hemolysin III family protein [Oscillospiraceae bacterium]